jgi:MFS family permease
LKARAPPGHHQAVKRTSRAVLAVACATHFLHDGFADIVYILLPLWAAEFHLSFAEVGFLRTLYSGGMALFQIPAGLLAERFGSAGCWPPGRR